MLPHIFALHQINLQLAQLERTAFYLIISKDNIKIVTLNQSSKNWQRRYRKALDDVTLYQLERKRLHSKS